MHFLAHFAGDEKIRASRFQYRVWFIWQQLRRLHPMLECRVCYLPFDWDERRPTCLSPCGHFVCLSCYNRLAARECPDCRGHIEVRIYPYHLRETVEQQVEVLKRRAVRNRRKNQKRRFNRKVKIEKLAQHNKDLLQLVAQHQSRSVESQIDQTKLPNLSNQNHKVGVYFTGTGTRVGGAEEI